MELSRHHKITPSHIQTMFFDIVCMQERGISFSDKYMTGRGYSLSQEEETHYQEIQDGSKHEKTKWKRLTKVKKPKAADNAPHGEQLTIIQVCLDKTHFIKNNVYMYSIVSLVYFIISLV